VGNGCSAPATAPGEAARGGGDGGTARRADPPAAGWRRAIARAGIRDRSTASPGAAGPVRAAGKRC